MNAKESIPDRPRTGATEGGRSERGAGGVLVVIPARFGASRLPGKPLLDLGGKPLVVRAAEVATRMRTATEVVVATDDERIRAAVAAAGITCEMTGEHPTGSDRVGEVAAGHPAAIIVNLQGDEPLLDPADGDRLVEALASRPDADLATCAHAFADESSWRDPHAVKVLVDRRGRALYFSRAAVPGGLPRPADSLSGISPRPWRAARRHVGIYAFRRSALERFLSLERGELERAEGLEQLRALEHGLVIQVVELSAAPVGVDTPADLERVRALWAARHA